MKKQLRGFVPGFITALLLVGLIGSAMAVTAQKQATLNYSDIKITLNGTAVTPTDAKGTAVEPFAIDGTTYLPIRGIANALGLGVEWDGATQTVKLTGAGASTPTGTASAGAVVMEKNGIKITYTGINYEGLMGAEVLFKVENTSGKTYGVQGREVSVNGYMITPVMSIEVASGKTANGKMTFLKSYLQENAITTFDNIEMKFLVFSADDFSNSFETDAVTINCK